MDKYFHINADKTSICCKLYREDNAPPESLILFGHGFGGHKDNRAAERFARRVMSKNRGAALLTFDWPAHGDDVRKTLVLEDCGLYLRRVLDYIRSELRPVRLLGYATSCGGYLMLRQIAMEGNPFSKLALRCPVISMYDVMTKAILREEELARLEKGKPVPVGFDRKVTIDRRFLEDVRSCGLMEMDFLPFADDLLIVHGTQDEIVPFETARVFAEENVIEFVPVEGADHRFQDPKKMDQATAVIVPFLGLK